MKIQNILATFLFTLVVVGAAIAADRLTIVETPNQTDGVLIQETASQKLGFHGATPVAQRAGAAQAAVSTNALTVSGTFDQAEVTAIATRATALTTLVNELRAALVEKGVIKGAAAE